MGHNFLTISNSLPLVCRCLQHFYPLKIYISFPLLPNGTLSMMFFSCIPVSKEKSYTLEHKGNTSSFGLTNTQELTPTWGFYSSNVFLGAGVDFHITFLWSLALGIQFTTGRIPMCVFLQCHPSQCEIRVGFTPLALDAPNPTISNSAPPALFLLRLCPKGVTIKMLTARRIAECDLMYFSTHVLD